MTTGAGRTGAHDDSARWWDLDGPHALLHAINPVRMAYLRERFGALAGLRVADVGCGGGILSEALAAEGAQVVGIDISEAAVKAAAGHAERSALAVDYRCCTAAELAAAEGSSFDAAVCMEVLEHVHDPAAEVAALAALLRPRRGGAVLATINRTAASYAAMIVGAEKILGALPAGSHNWQNFIRPAELAGWCANSGLEVADLAGANWSFFGKTFLLSRIRMPVNYFLHAHKRELR